MISCDDCVLVTCEIFPPGLIPAQCMSESGLVHAQIYDLHILGPVSAVWLSWLASYSPDCLQCGPCSAADSQSGRCIHNCRPITGQDSPAARPQTLQQPGTKQTGGTYHLTSEADFSVNSFICILLRALKKRLWGLALQYDSLCSMTLSLKYHKVGIKRFSDIIYGLGACRVCSRDCRHRLQLHNYCNETE